MVGRASEGSKSEASELSRRDEFSLELHSLSGS